MIYKIKVKKITILILLFFFSVPVFSQYFNHDTETDQLKRLYAANSIIFPTSSYPVSRKQLIVFAENLNSLISDSLFSSELSSLIKKLKNSDTIGIKASATGTYNYRTKELWPDYYRNFFDISPVFDIYMQLSSDIVAIEAREIWRREFQYFPDTNLTEAKEGDLFAAENQFLYLGLFSYQFEGMELLIGRAPVHFGDNDFNSLLPSKRLPFMDMVEIKIPIGPFELTGQVATLESREALEDDYSGDGSGDFDFGRNTILTALHRFEYRGERLRAAVAGFSVISRPDNGFMLGDVFPVFAWHTADVGWHNLALIGDLSYVPMEGLNLFLQTGFDDINASELFDVNDSDIPTVYAFIFGTSYFKDLEKSRFRAAFEAGKTHYLWGNFYAPGDSDEDGDHYFEKAVYRVFMDGKQQNPSSDIPVWSGGFVE